MLLASMLYAMLLAYPGRVFITPILPEKLIDMNPGTCIISFNCAGLLTLLYMATFGNT